VIPSELHDGFERYLSAQIVAQAGSAARAQAAVEYAAPDVPIHEQRAVPAFGKRARQVRSEEGFAVPRSRARDRDD